MTAAHGEPRLPGWIKHVGRGSRLAKDLTRAEAAEALRALAAPDADPVQIGAFLLALRMKGESAEELAGFVDGLRADARRLASPPDGPLVDVDLHGDGRGGRPSVSVAAACLATARGARVLLRGAFDQRFARNDLDEVLRRLRLAPAAPPEVVEGALARGGIGVLHLEAYAPHAARLLALRARLGVRTCVNSAVKLLDPAGAARLAVGIFHSPYHGPVAGAAHLLGVHRAAVVQAPGGIPEPSPDKPTRVTFCDGAPPGEPVVMDGGALPIGRHAPALPPEAHEPEALARLLEGVLRAPGDAAAGLVRMVVLQAALLLWVAGLAPSPTDAGVLESLLDALHRGDAAHVLDVSQGCYTV